MMSEHLYFILSIIIFIGAYILIIWDKFDRAVVAMCGAVLMILLRVVNQEEAFASIDFNTIGLLTAMMVIVMIMRYTGIFEYMAVVIVRKSKANPSVMLVLMALATGVLSAFLDNVTTILLMLPVLLSVTRDMKMNPIPFIITMVFASNVGGTATLIGDPPNIMIGSQTGLDFLDFLANDGLIALPLLILTSIIFAFIFKKYLVASDDDRLKVMAINPIDCIKDTVLLRKSKYVFALVVLGFLFHGMLGLESATIAIAGAVLLLLLSGMKSEEILLNVEWKTIFFFTGLFIMVGGIESTGVISALSKAVIQLSGGNLFITTITILWVSALASAFIDNIPFVATMIPLIMDMGQMSDINVGPLWWALSLGACLGGNGTIIGASANVIAVGMSEREGYHISFGSYFRVAFPVMLLTILITTVYVIFMYLM
jgi:Na+/H+ antiporter NhaD/arsenite permease-like protein